MIRLEFHILLHFEEKSSILRRLIKICKALYISKIRSYIYWGITSKVQDLFGYNFALGLTSV